jgi:hypothetical protein
MTARHKNQLAKTIRCPCAAAVHELPSALINEYLVACWLLNSAAGRWCKELGAWLNTMVEEFMHQVLPDMTVMLSAFNPVVRCHHM